MPAATNNKSKTTIPVLDLSLYKPDDPTAKESTELFLTQLDTTMREVGFFYVSNHGIPYELQLEAFETIKKFFALPLEEKLKIAMINSPHFRGYSQLYAETTDYKQDNREQIDLGHEVPALPADTEPAYLHMRGPNQWPENLPDFKVTILELMQQMEKVALVLLNAMARCLKMIDEKEFMKMFGENGTLRMKLARYPAMGNEHDKPLDHGLGVGPHKDYGFLAFLLQDQIGGLQVQTLDGEWVDATPIPNTFVVNIGEIFERMSRKTYIATTHRVLSNTSTTEDRFSIPLFLSPGLDTRIPQLNIENAIDRSNVKSDVKEEQLLQDELYGLNELRGFSRSHVKVAERWYYFDEETQQLKRRPVPL